MTQGGYQVIIILLIKSKMAAAKKQCFLRFLYWTESSPPSFKVWGLGKKKNKFVSGRWPENLNAKCVFFFFFLRGAKVNFQVNIHIIIQMVDEFVPSYVPFPMQLLLQSIYLLNICAFMHILHVHTSHMNKIQLYIVLGHECIHNWYFSKH